MGEGVYLKKMGGGGGNPDSGEGVKKFTTITKKMSQALHTQ